MERISAKKRGLSRDEASFLPWFLSQKVRYRVQKLLPRYYYFRLRLYYERYGCISCKKKSNVYGCNGLCRSCHSQIRFRLCYVDAKLERQFKKREDGAAIAFLRRLESAKRILGDVRAIMEC